ncbi:MAG: glycosyltransferase family 4 protein [Cyanobacteria bacterium P01_F01_bin.53]
MRVLSVHNGYKIRGGEDESCAAEEAMLRKWGHQVETYKDHNDRIGEFNPAHLALKTVWSQDTFKAVRSQLQQAPCDVVHVQNFFPLISPSIYFAAGAAGVPVVQTLRNYRLLCPNALFFREGRVCEDCLGKSVPYPGVMHGCYRNSAAASAGVAAMLTAHNAINTWQDRVDLYITLTEFARQKFIEAGFPAHKIVVKPNFVAPDPGVGQGEGDFALYVGRLSVEKGLDTLLNAWQKLSKPMPLKIVGDGPLSDMVEETIARSPHISWLGRQPMPEVHQLMGEAQFLVFPSKWYETFGRVAVEAYAKGTPVVASNIGAIAEIVDSGRTGLHFQPGDADDLASQVEWFLAHPDVLAQMRKTVRAEYEAKYTAEKNYQQLIDIYQQAQRQQQQAA